MNEVSQRTYKHTDGQKKKKKSNSSLALVEKSSGALFPGTLRRGCRGAILGAAVDFWKRDKVVPLRSRVPPPRRMAVYSEYLNLSRLRPREMIFFSFFLSFTTQKNKTFTSATF